MASTVKYAENVSLVRAIRRELRSATKNYKGGSDGDASVEHMLNLLRANQVTEKRFCRPQDHYRYFSETYLTYLKSSRLQDELTRNYFTKGERTVEESARLVGLGLPQQQNP